MTKYVVRIKPGVYYIDRGYSPLTNSKTYDLTDDINKATKYTETLYTIAKTNAKRVYGEVYKINSNIDEIEKLRKEVKYLREKLYTIKHYINDYFKENDND